jgi:hypothetical protein
VSIEESRPNVSFDFRPRRQTGHKLRFYLVLQFRYRLEHTGTVSKCLRCEPKWRRWPVNSKRREGGNPLDRRRRHFSANQRHVGVHLMLSRAAEIQISTLHSSGPSGLLFPAICRFFSLRDFHVGRVRSASNDSHDRNFSHISKSHQS